MSPKKTSLRLAATLAATVLAACQPVSTPTQAPRQPSNVLLITIDTLRADHLSSYGYPRRTSPVIDRLAAEGVRFDQAVAQWPKTGPSFASLFTATYPKDNHIVRRVGRPVPQEFRMLAEELAGQGYSTHAVVANGALASELNYDQGFDSYHETWKRGGELHRDNRAEIVTERARAAAESIDGEKPFFLWIHYIDPHFPYTPPEPWLEKFQDEPFDGDRQLMVRENRKKSQMRAIGTEQVLDGRTDLGFYVARYDAEIAYADAEIGKLLDFLGGRGLLDDTLTIVTSDHGESLGEHDYYFSHGRFAYETCLRVPLVFHYPGVFPPRVETAPVELIHVAPTILAAAGVPLGDGRWMQGSSLFESLAGGAPANGHPYAFAEAGVSKNRNWQKVVRDDRFKLILAPDWAAQRWVTGKKGDSFVLYDLENDPQETVNAAAEFPEDTTRLKRALHGWWNAEAFEVRRDAAPAGTTQEGMDEATREQLKALGYLN